MAQPTLSEKNAAYIAKMRARQSTNEPTGDYSAKPEKKISLFGANNDLLAKAKIEPEKKKNSKYVTLPDTGLTETQLLTKYQITVDKIGAGAFAKVKVVKEHQTGKSFALKYVKIRGVSYTDINTFKKEILYLSKLTNHPNIIRMYDFCESPIALYMVLEYCNGGDVAQQLEKCVRFSEIETKHITKQLVAGLCYCHQLGIVHRDLKPDNMMYNNGVIKLIDFGLAGDCTYKPLKTSCGTPHFASPELILGNDYKSEADMWSLGVCVYLFISGNLPFTEETNNQQKLLEVIKKGMFVFDKLFDECDASLKDFISGLLCMNVQKRMSAMNARNHKWFSAKGNGVMDRGRGNNMNNMKQQQRFGNQMGNNNMKFGGNNYRNNKQFNDQNRNNMQPMSRPFNNMNNNMQQRNNTFPRQQSNGPNQNVNVNVNNIQRFNVNNGNNNGYNNSQSPRINNTNMNNNNMQQRNNNQMNNNIQSPRANNQMNNNTQSPRANNQRNNNQINNNNNIQSPRANNQMNNNMSFGNNTQPPQQRPINNMNNMQQRHNNFPRQQSNGFNQNQNINQPITQNNTQFNNANVNNINSNTMQQRNNNVSPQQSHGMNQNQITKKQMIQNNMNNNINNTQFNNANVNNTNSNNMQQRNNNISPKQSHGMNQNQNQITNKQIPQNVIINKKKRNILLPQPMKKLPPQPMKHIVKQLDQNHAMQMNNQ